MTELVSAVCVLGIVILGLLMITRTIDLTELMSMLGKGFVMVVLAWWGICVLEGILPRAVESIRELATWTAILGVVIAGLAGVFGLISRLWARFGRGGNLEDHHE